MNSSRPGGCMSEKKSGLSISEGGTRSGRWLDTLCGCGGQ